MERSFLYFAIVCLAMAGGTPADEPRKLHTKVFNFGEQKDGIILLRLFSKDEMVYAVCEGREANKKCKIYGESVFQNENASLSCDLNLKYSSVPFADVALFNAGNSRAVLAVRDDESRIKLINVYLKDCHIKEAVLDVQSDNNGVLFMKVILAFHENTYDVVYRNKQLCSDFLCIATYDYEGKVVKKANSFPIKDLDSYIQMESLEGAYLVSENLKTSSNVYVIHEKDNNLHSHTLFRGEKAIPITLSAEEKKLAYCVEYQEKMMCKQYDASGETKKLEVETASRKGKWAGFNVLNLEKGLLTLAIRSCNGTSDQQMIVQHIDEHGKEGKEVKFNLNCDKKNAALPKLYKSSSGEYCVTFVCFDSDNVRYTHFTRSSRCFVNSELF